MPDFNILKECGINNIHSQINDLQPRLLILFNFISVYTENYETSNIILQTLQLKRQRGMCLFKYYYYYDYKVSLDNSPRTC